MPVSLKKKILNETSLFAYPVFKVPSSLHMKRAARIKKKIIIK